MTSSKQSFTLCALYNEGTAMLARLSCLFLTALLLSATHALADDGQVYIGIGAYQASVDGKVNGNAEQYRLDDSDNTLGVLLGYKLSAFFAVELGYYDLGHYRQQTTAPNGFTQVDLDYDVSAFSLGVNAILPLKIIDLYAKLGSTAVNKEVSVSSTFLDNDNSLETYVGVGGNINIGHHVEIFAEYSRFFAAEDVDVVGAGLRILF
jgi:hypothetical protein